jgi:hypothetical protein
LKNTFAIAALISAAAVLTPANATTILTTTLSKTTPGTLSLGAGNGYITAAGYDNGLPSNIPSGPPTSVTPSFSNPTAVGVNTDPNSKLGLGLGNNGDEIGPTDFVVLDFANVTAPANSTLTSVAFTLNVDVKEPTGAISDWVIYGENSNGTATLLDSGPMTPLGVIPIANTTTSASYTNYLIGIEGDCEIDIEQVALTYGSSAKTPEPGTFVMAGMALIGLGLTMKKHQRKS